MVIAVKRDADLPVPACFSNGSARSWRSRSSRKSGSTGSCARSPRHGRRGVLGVRVARRRRAGTIRHRSASIPDAVHLSQLKPRPGLVGTIASSSARSLNLSDAQKHPAFTYLPETGEEVYNSFLGVPILRAGRSLGVLVVQNKAHRQYREDEVEALETTSMVLAEMIAAGDLKQITRPGMELDLSRPVTFEGEALQPTGSGSVM
jgi:hypothetical protein